MATALQANANLTLTVTEQATNTAMVQRTIAGLTNTVVNTVFYDSYFIAGTGTSVITVPGVCMGAYVKNQTTAAGVILTVNWTIEGGVLGPAAALAPGGMILLFQPVSVLNTHITGMTLSASANSTPVEIMLFA